MGCATSSNLNSVHDSNEKIYTNFKQDNNCSNDNNKEGWMTSSLRKSYKIIINCYDVRNWNESKQSCILEINCNNDDQDTKQIQVLNGRDILNYENVLSNDFLQLKLKSNLQNDKDIAKICIKLEDLPLCKEQCEKLWIPFSSCGNTNNDEDIFVRMRIFLTQNDGIPNSPTTLRLNDMEGGYNNNNEYDDVEVGKWVNNENNDEIITKYNDDFSEYIVIYNNKVAIKTDIDNDTCEMMFEIEEMGKFYGEINEDGDYLNLWYRQQQQQPLKLYSFQRRTI